MTSGVVSEDRSVFSNVGDVANKPIVSVIIPVFNEAAILEPNLQTVAVYLESLSHDYDWEMVIVNDGSSDGSAEIADRFARGHPHVKVIHHAQNRGLGQGFKTGFAHASGDYLVTIDIDLSYTPEHIGSLLAEIRKTQADMVLASPYMKAGGRVSNVPTLRRVLSIWANRLLSFSAQGHISTLTCMVRAYDRKFVESLDFRAEGMDVMPEMIYKSMILRGRIAEVPAHLDWALQVSAGVARRSSMRILRHLVSTIISGLFFRPFMFFIAPGLVLLVFSIYVIGWMLTHFMENYWVLTQYSTFGAHASAALAAAYSQSPHTFIVGFLSLMLTIQLISLGVISLQSKRYFEEVYYQGAMTNRLLRQTRKRSAMSDFEGDDA